MSAETPLSAHPLYSARPLVRLDGAPDERLDALLLSMRLDEDEDGMGRLELGLSQLAGLAGGGTEPAFGPGGPLQLGTALRVAAGDVAAPVALFHGRVSALEWRVARGGTPELGVLAEDALQGARRQRRSRVLADRTLADVVRLVAADLNLRAQPQALDQVRGTWVQFNESDLAFLRRLLARAGAGLQVVDDELQAGPAHASAHPEVALDLFGQLHEVRVVADLADQVTAVTCAGWDAEAGRAVTGVADAIEHPGPGSGRTGVRWLQEAAGPRSEHVGHAALGHDDEARAFAQAAMDRRARGFVRLHGVAEGNPRLRVGTPVRIRGTSPWFDNTYRVIAASHRFDTREGYRTAFTAECAYLGDGP